MATRPVFVTTDIVPFFVRNDTSFEYCPGFAVSQKRKSIENLHQEFLKQYPDTAILEISSKSENPIGRQLSAFFLPITLKNGEKTTVESAFQSSKVFLKGGPYKDLLYQPSLVAKRDERLRSSGPIVGFDYEGEEFATEPKHFFYAWLYAKALNENKELAEKVMEYDAFTDIEFQPQKSINCQAMAAAIFVSLKRKGLLEEALRQPKWFAEIVSTSTPSDRQMTFY